MSPAHGMQNSSDIEDPLRKTITEMSPSLVLQAFASSKNLGSDPHWVCRLAGVARQHHTVQVRLLKAIPTQGNVYETSGQAC
jgi:hypothetical protein